MVKRIDSVITKPISVINIPVDDVVPDPNQPRRHIDEEELTALSASIDAIGLLNPILVAKDNDRWRIVAGERRWRAVKILGIPTIPAIDFTMSNQRFVQIAENTARSDLKPKEIMDVVDQLTQEGTPVKTIAEVLGLSERSIQHYRSVLIDTELTNQVRSGNMPIGQAVKIKRDKSYIRQNNHENQDSETFHPPFESRQNNHDEKDDEAFYSTSKPSNDIQQDTVESPASQLSSVQQEICDYCEAITSKLIFVATPLALDFMVDALKQVVASADLS